MKKRPLFLILGIPIFLLSLGIDAAVVLGVFITLGVGTGTRYLWQNRPTSLDRVNTKTRLLDLKETINRCDRQLKVLENYLDQRSYTQYAILAKQVLPQLADIQAEADQLKQDMDLNIYKRISKKVGMTTTDIQVQLEALNVPADLDPDNQEEADLLKLAPELMTTYANVQADHQTILKKIEEANLYNKAELTALHEAEMTRFQDILAGYLKIKAEPKNYYNADERLAKAKLALEDFDKNLDETIRRLNESDLQDFEISLRMMAEKNNQPNDHY